MRELTSTAVSLDLLSSPLSNHILAYSAPTPTVLPAIPKPVYAPAPANAGSGVIGSGIPAPVAVSVGGSGLEASLGLNQSISLTGGENSPATAQGSNDPGLVTPGTTGGKMGGNWIMILLIIAVIVGLVYYFNPGNILAR